MGRRTALGYAADTWAELVCPFAKRALEANDRGTHRSDRLARWRRLHQLDTILAATYLEARERRFGENAPFLLQDFIPPMQRGGNRASTMACARRRFTALAEFDLVRIEGRPQRVRMGLTDHPHWPESVRQLGERLVQAFDAWTDACGPARTGDPIRDSDTARCFAHMVDAGFAPGRPIRQGEVLNDMLDEARGLSKRHEIEQMIVPRRTFDLRARTRVALTRRRDVLVDHGVLTVKYDGVKDTMLTLTGKGEIFHAAAQRVITHPEAA